MGEQEVLAVMATEMSNLGLNYFYMVNDSETVSYPYITGEYNEYQYTFEDRGTIGEMLLEVWTRGSELELLTVKDKIKTKFENYQASISDSNHKNMSLSIIYLNKVPRRTDVEGLKKLEIRLQINYWESE